MRQSVASSILLIAAGALKVPLWLLFISLHGPTSYNEERQFLAGDPELWGAVMSGIPSLLVVAGLLGYWATLSQPLVRRVGLVLLIAALGVPALLDLSTRSLWPPLLLPLLAAGAIVIGASGRSAPRLGALTSTAFLGIGVLVAAVFAYAVFIPPAVFDEIGGYRLQGIVEHIAVGLGWIAVGVGLLRITLRASPGTN